MTVITPQTNSPATLPHNRTFSSASVLSFHFITL